VDSSIVFTSTYPFAAGSSTRWHWNFGDGQFINSTNSNSAIHLYTIAATNRVVKHIVDLGGGCYSDTVSIIITNIFANPIANFAIVKDTLCVNTLLSFTSSSTGNYTWNWNFGNGIGNNIPPFTKTYNSAGTYNVSLRLLDVNGCGSNMVNDQLIINTNPIVNAGLDQFIQTGSTVTLNAIVSPTGNYNYTWSPSATLNNANSSTTIATPNTTTTYLLQVADPISNCFGEDAVTISVFDKLYIPNVFTPNKDGKNDTWELLGLALYPDAVVRIYNRWGQKILDTKNYYTKPWDGKLKGVEVPSGVYVYLIELNNAAKEIRKGTVLIVR
jgi:gliding motility-associated-like protein